MSDQRGMTLVELMVAMVMGTIVILAASAVIISALDVTRQVTGRETAMSQGRTGIETLLAQLNSACLVANDSPVQAGTSGISSISPAVSSDGSHLVFTTGLNTFTTGSNTANDSTSPAPVLHVVQITGGALLDSAYAYAPGNGASLGIPSTWTFASTPTQVLNLAQNVTPPVSGAPMFSYYAYSATAPYSLMGASALTPSATNANTIAEVDLDLRFLPSASYQANQTSELQDSAVFSLTAQDSAGANEPCQ